MHVGLDSFALSRFSNTVFVADAVNQCVKSMICLYVLIVVVLYGIRHKNGTGLWYWIVVFRFQKDENPFVF